MTRLVPTFGEDRQLRPNRSQILGQFISTYGGRSGEGEERASSRECQALIEIEREHCDVSSKVDTQDFLEVEAVSHRTVFLSDGFHIASSFFIFSHPRILASSIWMRNY